MEPFHVRGRLTQENSHERRHEHGVGSEEDDELRRDQLVIAIEPAPRLTFAPLVRMAQGHTAHDNSIQMNCPRMIFIRLGKTPAKSHPNGIELAKRLVPTVPKHWTIPKRANPTRQLGVKLLLRIRLQISQMFQAVTYTRQPRDLEMIKRLTP